MLSACLVRSKSSTLNTNTLKMNFLLMGTQHFHDIKHRGPRFSYLFVLLAFSQRQQNQSVEKKVKKTTQSFKQALGE